MTVFYDYWVYRGIQWNKMFETFLSVSKLRWMLTSEFDIVHLRLIDSFFLGLRIDEVYFARNDLKVLTGEVFVKFVTANDADLAIKLNGEKVGGRIVKIIRSSDRQMTSAMEIEGFVPSDSSSSNGNEYFYIQIRGLPWNVDNAYILNLFPGKHLFVPTN